MIRTLAPYLLLLALTCSASAQITRKVSIRARDQPVGRVLETLCRVAGLNLVLGPELQGKKVSLELKQVEVGRILRYLGALNDFGVGLTSDGKTVLAGSKAALASFEPTSPRVIPLGNSSAEKTASLLQRVYKGKLEAIADPHTNSVILVPGN